MSILQFFFPAFFDLQIWYRQLPWLGSLDPGMAPGTFQQEQPCLVIAPKVWCGNAGGAFQHGKGTGGRMINTFINIVFPAPRQSFPKHEELLEI